MFVARCTCDHICSLNYTAQGAFITICPDAFLVDRETGKFGTLINLPSHSFPSEFYASSIWCTSEDLSAIFGLQSGLFLFNQYVTIMDVTATIP